MAAVHSDLALVGPASRELPLRTDEDRARVTVDEELRHVTLGQPVRVSLHDLDHVSGLAVDRNLSRPCEGWTPRLAGFQVRPAILGHLLFAQVPENRTRQDSLHEDVLLQHDFLTGRRTHCLEDASSRVGPRIPRYGLHDRLHVSDAAHRVGMPPRPVEAEARAPVVHHEGHVAGGINCFEPGIEIPAVVGEAIPPPFRRPRVPHSDEVRGEATTHRLYMGDDVAPEIRRRRIPVQEDDRLSASNLDVSHVRIEHWDRQALREGRGRDVCFHCDAPYWTPMWARRRCRLDAPRDCRPGCRGPPRWPRSRFRSRTPSSPPSTQHGRFVRRGTQQCRVG